MDNTLLQTENVVVETQNQLMTLVDEANSAISTVPFEKGSATVSTASEFRQHNITDFLKREIKIAYGTISANMTRGTTIAQISVPNDIINHPMNAFKVDGFRYIKGTAQIRVVFNNQPFQAGIFKAIYFPVLSPNNLYNSSLDSLKALTGLDGVDVNLEDREPLVLDIPYIYPLPAYDMLTEPDPFAYFRLVVYSPLSSGTISYTIFARFLDVELSMPISAPLPGLQRQYKRVLQQGGSPYNFPTTEKIKTCDDSKKIFKVFSTVGLIGGIMSALILIYRMWFPRRVKQQIGAEDKKAKPPGIITTIAKTISGIAQVVSGIPLLASIAVPVRLVASGVGSIASHYGWAKPRSQQVLTIIRPKIVEGFNNTNNVEFSQKMALDSLNSTIVTDGKFGSEIDQMAFASLWRVPQYIGNFTISTSSAVESLVYSAKLNPIDLTTTYHTTNKPVTIETTNLGMVCSLFELWKGSLNFNFKAAKTQFHSMRLAIVYFNQEDAPPSTYTSDTIKNYQIIWDVRETYQQTVNIPYIQNIEWMNMSSVDTTFKDHTGYIGIYVLNELVVGGTASNSIDILVEAFAGHDFHVAIPRNPQLGSYYIKPITTYIDSSASQIVVTRTGQYAATFNIPWISSPYTISGQGAFEIDVSLVTGLVVLPDLTPVTAFKIGNTQNWTAITYRLNNETLVEIPIDDTTQTLTLPIGFRWPSTTAKLKVAKTKFKNGKLLKAESLEIEDLTANTTSVGSSNFKDTSQPKQDFEYISQNTNHDYPDSSVQLIKSDGTSLNKAVTETLKLVSLNEQEAIFYLCEELLYVKYMEESKQYAIDHNFSKEVTFEFLPNPKFIGYSITLSLQKNKEADKYRLVLWDPYNVTVYLDCDIEVERTKKVAQQIGKIEALTKPVFDNITGSVVDVPYTHEHTVGEDIMSLRQLGHRYTLFRNIKSLTTTSLGGGSYFMFNPFSFTGDDNPIVDYLSFFAPLYRFYNGELNFKFIILDENNLLYTKPVEIYLLSNYSATTPPNQAALVSSKIYHFPTLEGMGEFTVSYYNRNHKTIVGDTTNTKSLSPIPHRILIKTSQSSTDLRVVVYRSIGENFSFGTTLSAPLMVGTLR